jgi:hypothetical protein
MRLLAWLDGGHCSGACPFLTCEKKEQIEEQVLTTVIVILLQ